jgi:hypothetical protein
MLFGPDSDKLNKATENDYQPYIESLPPGERMLVDSASIWYFADGGGHYAVRIEIPANGVWLYHVLIYDKDYKRTQTIKYTAGRYRS